MQFKKIYAKSSEERKKAYFYIQVYQYTLKIKMNKCKKKCQESIKNTNFQLL